MTKDGTILVYEDGAWNKVEIDEFGRKFVTDEKTGLKRELRCSEVKM